MKAVQLLLQAATLYHEQKESFSKTEILKRINQIKYLSKKKGSSKFDIRKEIIKLENQMQDIFELEKKIVSKKKQESVKLASLRRQLTMSKKKLAASKDKDLVKKVDRLSHLLGDFLAKHGTKEEIALTKKLIPELHLPRSPYQPKISKLEQIEHRLQLLKHELELKKSMEKNPKVIAVLSKQIEMLDKKVQAYASSPHIEKEFTINVQKSATERHTIKFDTPPVRGKLSPDQLPPPPQPKYR
tara:strand:- start:35683 stop:36411 length:729 start_codon:yes stop_codon:yes gene_type:complete